MYRLHDSARVHENWDNRVKTDLRANLVKTDLRANLVKPKATGKNVNEQPNLARVRETGRTSAKHSHLGKNTVFRRCFMVARANLAKTDLRAKT